MRFAYAEIDRAYAERDPDIIRRLAEPTCSGCSNFIGAVERIAREGLSVEGARSRVLSAETPGGQTGTVEVVTRSSFSGLVLRDREGNVVLSEQPAELELDFTLLRKESGWSITRIVSV